MSQLSSDHDFLFKHTSVVEFVEPVQSAWVSH